MSETRAPLILGIESSCDETAASVVRGGTHVLSNVIATQHDLHARYAGVVPEIASRAHLERILPVIEESLGLAHAGFTDLDAVAVGHRPGLIGSLLVGVSAAKALSWALDIPLIGVDHVRAHLYAGLLDAEKPSSASWPASSAASLPPRRPPAPPAASYPALGLVVSGGHTSLFLVSDPATVTLLGRTIDDAIGEAFDKAATILDLGYPGGPRIDALAADGDDAAHDFPVSALGRGSLDFSFSGLKTALLYAVRGLPEGRGANTTFPRDAAAYSMSEKADFAASFQRAAVTAITRKLRRAFDREPEARTLLVGGGVAANTRLRRELSALATKRGIDLRLPPMEYCLDNAAMIAGFASSRFERGEFDDLTLSASARCAE